MRPTASRYTSSAVSPKRAQTSVPWRPSSRPKWLAAAAAKQRHGSSSLRSAAPPSLEAGCWKNGGAPRYPCRYRERRERCPKSRFSVNIFLTDPEPFSECLRDPEKSYRTLTGNLTEIDKIIWNTLPVRISPCVLVILGGPDRCIGSLTGLCVVWIENTKRDFI